MAAAYDAQLLNDWARQFLEAFDKDKCASLTRDELENAVNDRDIAELDRAVIKRIQKYYSEMDHVLS